MAVPKKRKSNARTGKHRSHLALTHLKKTISHVLKCPNCGTMKLAHRVCSSCGKK